jgi:hypothetical protein
MSLDIQHDTDPTTLFRQLDAYSWDEDAEFQGGLSAILGSVQDPDQVAHLTLRAKCYYYARKAGTPVDFDGYKQWREQNSGPDTGAEAAPIDAIARNGHPSLANGNVSTVVPEPPKPATFAEICDMIAEGKPIPGIKDIPDTVLEGQASESQASRRKKPWEKDASAADSPSWMT